MRSVETLARISPPEPRPIENDLDLVVERVRLQAQRRAAWLDHLLHEADASPAPLEDRDRPDRQADWLSQPPRGSKNLRT